MNGRSSDRSRHRFLRRRGGRCRAAVCRDIGRRDVGHAVSGSRGYGGKARADIAGMIAAAFVATVARRRREAAGVFEGQGVISEIAHPNEQEGVLQSRTSSVCVAQGNCSEDTPATRGEGGNKHYFAPARLRVLQSSTSGSKNDPAISERIGSQLIVRRRGRHEGCPS